uniref:Uncharacterized protein n=1 Tax=Timema monikensis TaxID=170555 RepID=A0A7R9EEK4_9NEOP|nr:unnamed protein product [Timema monikensis]
MVSKFRGITINYGNWNDANFEVLKAMYRDTDLLERGGVQVFLTATSNINIEPVNPRGSEVSTASRRVDLYMEDNGWLMEGVEGLATPILASHATGWLMEGVEGLATPILASHATASRHISQELQTLGKRKSSSTVDEAASKYPYFQALQFVVPVITTKNTISNLCCEPLTHIAILSIPSPNTFLLPSFPFLARFSTSSSNNTPAAVRFRFPGMTGRQFVTLSSRDVDTILGVTHSSFSSSWSPSVAETSHCACISLITSRRPNFPGVLVVNLQLAVVGKDGVFDTIPCAHWEQFSAAERHARPRQFAIVIASSRNGPSHTNCVSHVTISSFQLLFPGQLAPRWKLEQPFQWSWDYIWATSSDYCDNKKRSILSKYMRTF